MSIVKKTSKASYRFFTIGLILALVSSFALASNWASVKTFAQSVSESFTGSQAENKNSEKNPQSLSPQTVVLSDNFEGATTFLTANVAATNQWFIGTAAANGGTMGAYISNDAGVTNAYGLATTSTNHIYAPITVPAGESAVVLSFDWKGVAEHDATTTAFDYLRVSITTAAPVGGTFPALADQLPVIYSGQDNYTKAHVNLPASIADGLPRFLVFTWRNDSSLGNQPPAAIDNVMVTSLVPAPLSGAKTIPGDYPTVGAAIANVNAHGADTSGGSLTFNVAAGSSFTETPAALTVSGSSATNRIVFQKSGAGANPLITAEGSSNFGSPSTGSPTSTSDAVIALNGVDFVTFDGIDLAINSPQIASPFSAIEYGYLIRNNNILANVTTINGSQNNIIQNTSITLDRRKTTGVGILQTAATATGAGSAATSAAQSNSGNKYYNLTIQNAGAGVYLLGTAAFPDDLTEVGVAGAVTQNTIGGAAANDIGNGTAATWGIRLASQSNAKIFKNEIRNVTSTSGTSAGIHMDNAGTVTAVSLGTTEINNNVIHDISGITSVSVGIVYGIRANLTGNAGSVSKIFNNFIYGLNSSSTSTTSVRLFGIQVQDAGTGTLATHNVQYNSVRIAQTSLTTINTCFGTGGAAVSNPTYNVRNNIFANFTGAQAGAAKHYTWVSTSNTTIGLAAGTVSDFNVLHINNPTNGFIGRGSTIDYADLTAWRAMDPGAGPDDNSRSQNPQFISATNLHIDTTLATPVESNATPIPTTTIVDIDGDARSGATPDIGADEGTFIALLANDIAATAVLVPVPSSTILNGSISTPQASFTNAGTANQVGVMVQFTITGPGGYSYTDTQTIASITSGATVSQTFLAAPAYTTAGLYTATATNLFADSNAANDSVMATFTVADPLSGAYTVGTAGAYPSLTNAGGIFDAINALGASGAVTINITSDLTGETGAVLLNPIAGNPAVLIKPSVAPRTISGVAPIAVIRINGADNIRIDGSTAASVVGGTPALRELTVQNLSTSTSSGVIHIGSATESSTGNTVQNVIALGNDPLQTISGISTGGASPTSTALFVNNNTRIQNCSIQRVQQGIFTRGVSQATLNTGTVITENDLSATGVNRVRQFGIFVGNEDGIQIDQNSIGGIDTLDVAGDTFGIAAGIGAIGTTTTTTTFGVTNAVIARNKINGVSQSATFSAAGIAVAGIAGTNTIANNMITGVISDGNGGDLPAGIFVTGVTGTTTRLYYNSVSMTGDRNLLLTPGVTQEPSYGIAISGTDPIVVLRNNIFYTSQIAEAVANPNALSFGIGMTTAAFTNLDSNFNDFWSFGVRDGGFRTGSLSGGLGTNHVALSDWTTATGDDATPDSLEVDPSFVNPLSDLHLTGIASPLYDQGTPITSPTFPIAVLDDFDGTLRSLVGFAGGVPDIGGDEALAPLAANGSISGRVLAADGAGIRNAVITVTGGTLTEPRVIRTSAFGYYAIDDLELGNTYVVTVRSKRFTFANQSVVVTLQENVGDLDFQAIP